MNDKEKIIILNHKMNLLYDDVPIYIDKLNKLNSINNIIVCPSNIYLESFINNCYCHVGSQDVCYEENGNYTGKVSAIQLKSMGVQYAIVGHKELKTTNENRKKKIDVCLNNNIVPIVCLKSQKDLEVFEGIEHINFIIIAYEPDTLYSKEEIDNIFNILLKKYNIKPIIVYGGKVGKKNIKTIIENEKLSGVMIGSISSNIDSITEIIDELE